MAAKTKVEIDIDITPDMLAAGLQVLVDSGREPPTGADEVLVTDIYKAMVRARSRDAAVHVTVPGVIEPGAELVVKNESDQPIRVVADPHERLKLKTRERPWASRRHPTSLQPPTAIRPSRVSDRVRKRCGAMITSARL